MRDREYERLFIGFDRNINHHEAWKKLLDEVEAARGEKARAFVEMEGLDNAALTLEEFGIDQHPWFAEHPYSWIRRDIESFHALCVGEMIFDDIDNWLRDAEVEVS